MTRQKLVERDFTRHVRTPDGSKYFDLPIGAPIVDDGHSAKPPGSYDPGYLPNGLTTEAEIQKTHTAEEIKQIADPSRRIQRAAQIFATQWYDRAQQDADAEFASTPAYEASEFWQKYQSPRAYTAIQNALRSRPGSGNKFEDEDGKEYDQEYAEQMATFMFARGGAKTKQPITLYRGLRDSENYHPADAKVGDVIQEPGITSSTAYLPFAEGWMNQDSHGNLKTIDEPNPVFDPFSFYVGGGTAEVEPVQTENVVMAVHVPTGARIMGGNKLFVETMLPPGSKYRITKITKVRTTNAESPLDPRRKITPFTYTRIDAEMVT